MSDDSPAPVHQFDWRIFEGLFLNPISLGLHDGSTNQIRQEVAGIASGLNQGLNPSTQLDPQGPYGNVPAAHVNITENTKVAYKFFRDHGWSDAQSLGIVANLIHESGLNAHGKPGDSGLAIGVGQWHADRQQICRNALGYDLSNPNTTLEQQLAFVDYELNHSEKAAGDLLRRSNDPRQAAAIVSSYYERPKDRQGNEIARASEAAGLAVHLSGADTVTSSAPNRGPAITSAAPAEAAAPQQTASAGSHAHSRTSVLKKITDIKDGVASWIHGQIAADDTLPQKAGTPNSPNRGALKGDHHASAVQTAAVKPSGSGPAKPDAPSVV